MSGRAAVGEHVESGVEAALAAPIGFMVGFGGDKSDQSLEFVIGGVQGGAVAVSAHAEHQPFAVGVKQYHLAQCCGR